MKNKVYFSLNNNNFCSITLKSLIFCLILGGFFVFSPLLAKAWSEPTDTPPGGNVAAPLNISSSSQRKIGPLILGDGDNPGILRLEQGDKTGDPCTVDNNGEIYYDDDGSIYYCKTSDGIGYAWIQLGAGGSGVYVQLNANNQGWTKIEGTNNDQYAIYGLGSDFHDEDPLKAWSAGVYGVSYGTSPLGYVDKRFGVFGQASDSDYSAGIHGWDANNADAYAGYFKGNVLISTGAGVTDLTLGEGVSLCFGENDCHDSWVDVIGGGGGESYWSQSGGITYVTDTSSDVAVGGSGSYNSPFYVSTAGEGGVVIGMPTGLSSEQTCGDEVCNGVESSDPNSGDYCDHDCPALVTSINIVTTDTTADVSFYVHENILNAYFEYGLDTGYGTKLSGNFPASFPGTVTFNQISGLTSGNTYYYRISVRDDDDRWTVSTGAFVPKAFACGDDICEVALGEVCNICPEDCSIPSQQHGGCPGTDWCCSDGDCDPICCIGEHAGCGAEWCNNSHECVQCLYDNHCVFLFGLGAHCCSDGNCYAADEDCPSGGGKDPFPTGYNTQENENESRVLGISSLSQSLLIPGAKAQTGWFENIIPTANASVPFDEEYNRRLTVYNGVATIFNSSATASHALEIGKMFKASAFPWISEGIGIYSSGTLVLATDNGTTPYLIKLDPNSGNTYFPGQLISGMTPGSAGDLKIYRDGVCATGGCRALTSLNDGYLILNYNNDFSSGTYTQGKLGVGQYPTGAKLVVNNPAEAGKIGSAGDAIYAFANSGNAAISAEQTGSGYAGYFSSKNSANPALYVKNEGTGYTAQFDGRTAIINSSGTSLFVFQGTPTDYAGYFSGKVGIYDGDLQIGLEGGSSQICLNSECISAWPDPGAGADDDWTIAAPNIYSAQTGNVGIGQSSPASKLTINVNTNNVGAARDAVHISQNATVSGGSALYVEQNSGAAYAGYFSGRTRISAPNDIYVNTMTALQIINNKWMRPVGVDISVPQICGLPGDSSYGLRVVTGDWTPCRSGDGEFIYGAYISAGRAGTQGERASYGIYAELSPTVDHTGYAGYFKATPGSSRYAGYFEGDVTVTSNLVVGNDISLSGDIKQTINGTGASVRDRIYLDTLTCPANMYVCGVKIIERGPIDAGLGIQCCQ